MFHNDVLEKILDIVPTNEDVKTTLELAFLRARKKNLATPSVSQEELLEDILQAISAGLALA